MELRDPEQALRHLEGALPGSVAEPDSLGRTSFLLGVAHYHAGQHFRALRCEVDAWRHIELTPRRRGYLRDTTSYVGIFLRGAEPSADRWVQGHLERFKKRLAVSGDWAEVRTYLRWLEGLVEARGGDYKRAIERLDRVRRRFLKTGPTRVAVAVTADLAMVYSRSRGLHQQTIDAISPILSRCLQSPPQPLGTELRLGLEQVSEVLDDRPESVFDALVALRSSFLAPIPGILAERIGGR